MKISSDVALPLVAVSLIFVMLVPLPALVLDFLLTLSITASLLVFLAAIQIQKPVELSVFPTLLLLLTLFRLALNLASSRRILLHGNEGVAAAGDVIASFGQFVVGGNYIVGFVLFLALIAIQFLVISHGAVRTAEVTARFTLDALPGKQMAIDADLNAGLIDEAGANSRRQTVAAEAEFYGAMDGAARFSQRDAMATILITGINIIAGFLIGVFQLKIPFASALKTYTILTVGDGLVTMIPSLLVSVAGGIVLTRTTAESSLGSELVRQVVSNPSSLFVAAPIVLALSLVPGLPKVPFVIVAAAVAWYGVTLRKSRLREQTSATPGTVQGEPPIEKSIKIDPISLKIGYGLVKLVDESNGGKLLQKVRTIRRQLTSHLGFVIPPFSVADDLTLRPFEYTIEIRGMEISRFQLEEGRLLAIPHEPQPSALPGIETKDPAFLCPAKWIDPGAAQQALASGYAVFEEQAVLATHIAEVLKSHAHELLGRGEVKRLMDTLSESHPKLVEELVPRHMSLGEVQRVLQHLLREQVPIRDLSTILETLAELSPVNKTPVFLVESVRQALGRAVAAPYLKDTGEMSTLVLATEIEEQIIRSTDPRSGQVDWQPSLVTRIVSALRNGFGADLESAQSVLLCPSPSRFHLKRLIEPFAPRIQVLSPLELPSNVRLRKAGVLE